MLREETQRGSLNEDKGSERRCLLSIDEIINKRVIKTRI